MNVKGYVFMSDLEGISFDYRIDKSSVLIA